MSFSKKTWVDRAVEFAGRRLLTAVAGIADTFTVTRAEGTEFVVGDPINATNLNDLETRIANEFINLDRKLTSNATDIITYARVNTPLSGTVTAGTTVDLGSFLDGVPVGKTFVGAHITPIASVPIIMSYYNGHVYAYSLSYTGSVTYTMTIYYKD